VTNALIKARKAVDKENAHEGEDIPIISTSVGYGVYMAVSSNLRYILTCFCSYYEKLSFVYWLAPADLSKNLHVVIQIKRR
jgi:Protein RETICULATA-related